MLAFAPGGQNSQIGYWQRSPRNPTNPAPWLDATTSLAKSFRVIAMDLRNAGKSRGRVTAADDWRTFARDHLALMDHLRVARCHVIGGCIGATFCMTLCDMAPSRIAAAVLLNPIGTAAAKTVRTTSKSSRPGRRN